MFVQLIDAYLSVLPGAIPSRIIDDFLLGNPEDVANSIYALGAGLATIGFYFVFFNQYLSDKIGRKRMLVITTFGMALTMLLMTFSGDFIQYIILLSVVFFLSSSDMWLIYINEESPQDKRALYSNLVLMAGLTGPVIMIIFRSIFLTETSPSSNWRYMMLPPIIVGFPLCAVIAFTLRETKKYREVLDTKDLQEVRAMSLVVDLKKCFQVEARKSYIALIVCGLLKGIAGMYFGLCEQYIEDESTLAQNQINTIFLWTAFGVFIAYLINGLLADKIGRKPLIYIWCGLYPIGIIIVVVGVNAQQYSYPLIMLGFALAIICNYGSLGVLRLATIEILPTERRGTGVGFRGLIGSAGGTIGLVLGSVFILHFGLGVTFIFFSLSYLGILPLNFLYIKETKGVDLSKIE
jgi:MFS family permease